MVIIVVIALCALATFFLIRMRNRRRTQVSPGSPFFPSYAHLATCASFWLQLSHIRAWIAGVRVCACRAGGFPGRAIMLQAHAVIASVQQALLLYDNTDDCRVLPMWPCSHTLTSRGRDMGSSQGTAVTPAMGSGRAMDSSRAMGSSQAMGSKDMQGSLTVAHTEATEATSLLGTLHKVADTQHSMLICHDVSTDSSTNLADALAHVEHEESAISSQSV